MHTFCNLTSPLTKGFAYTFDEKILNVHQAFYKVTLSIFQEESAF